VQKHVEKVLVEQEKSGPPRFETAVDVVGKSPQVMLERALRGQDLECAPSPGGVPTEVEMRAVRRTPPPYVDFLALSGVLAKKLKGKGPDRYFLYRLRRADGGVSYSLREQRVPDSSFYNTLGTTFELVETFSDRDIATKAWRRLERGFETPFPTVSASPPPPWVTTTCRPPN